jgi:hypothetical protein
VLGVQVGATNCPVTLDGDPFVRTVVLCRAQTGERDLQYRKEILESFADTEQRMPGAEVRRQTFAQSFGVVVVEARKIAVDDFEHGVSVAFRACRAHCALLGRGRLEGRSASGRQVVCLLILSYNYHDEFPARLPLAVGQRCL